MFSVLACWVSMEQERPPRSVCSLVTPEYLVEMPILILTGEKPNEMFVLQ